MLRIDTRQAEHSTTVGGGTGVRSGEYAELPRARHRLGAAVDGELAEDIIDVGLYGAHGDDELTCDLHIRPARGEKVKHLKLSRTQRLGQRPRAHALPSRPRLCSLLPHLRLVSQVRPSAARDRATAGAGQSRGC